MRSDDWLMTFGNKDEIHGTQIAYECAFALGLVFALGYRDPVCNAYKVLAAIIGETGLYM